jgi:hypothetical protein
MNIIRSWMWTRHIRTLVRRGQVQEKPNGCLSVTLEGNRAAEEILRRDGYEARNVFELRKNCGSWLDCHISAFPTRDGVLLELATGALDIWLVGATATIRKHSYVC